MWQTVLTIPERIGPLPVFGWGWAVIAWSVACAISFFIVARRYGWQHVTGSIPFAVVIGAVLVFLLPRMELERVLPAGDHIRGLPIRGYGIMLAIAVFTGVQLARRRAIRRGLSADVIFSLATWMFVLGIVGARLFYVVLEWEQFKQESLAATVGSLLNVSQGGLVVYGSLFGALLGFFIFVNKHKLPPLMLADLIAPAMLVGLALGRIGCFLNGCCYGGACELPWAVQFPQESVPYAEQLRDGSLHGFEYVQSAEGIEVSRVDANSQLSAAGLQVGDKIRSVNGRTLKDEQFEPAAVMAYLVESGGTQLTISTEDGKDVSSSLSQLPAQTTPLHPTQMYSSINAWLLLFFLLSIEPYLTRDGQLMALMIAIYPLMRFLLEVIRTDETSFGSTGMTISQNISVLLLAFGVGLWWYLSKQPAGRRQVVSLAR